MEGDVFEPSDIAGISWDLNDLVGRRTEEGIECRLWVNALSLGLVAREVKQMEGRGTSEGTSADLLQPRCYERLDLGIASEGTLSDLRDRSL